MARRNQDRGQQMYKDAPASEAEWDKVSPPRSGGSASPKRDIIALRAPPSETSREPEEPAAERPVETPEIDHPAEPAEKTERPAKPAEKEAEPGQQPAAKDEKPERKAAQRLPTPTSGHGAGRPDRALARGGGRHTSTGIIPRISNRPTTPSSRRASSRSRPRSRATSPRFRSPTTSMSTRAT